MVSRGPYQVVQVQRIVLGFYSPQKDLSWAEKQAFKKVVRHDQLDTTGPSETLSGTSCPQQPHLGGHKDTPSLDIVRAISGRRLFYKSC